MSRKIGIGRRICPGCLGRKDFYAKACRKCAVPIKPLLGKKGDRHPAWRGGTVIDRDGYIRTYDPAHPWPRRPGYVLEHVRVMELQIGRRLTTEEIIHHKDHDRQNNDLSNLELLTRSAHSRYHNAAGSAVRKRNA